MTSPLEFRIRTLSWALDLLTISAILQKLNRTSVSCSAAAVGVTYSVENVSISLIDSMFWELLLFLAKFSENKAFLELVFPTSAWTAFCSPPLSCFLTWLLSRVTVIGSCCLQRLSSQSVSPFKSSLASADTAFSIKLYSLAVFRILWPQGL